jgi:hypothetical protein
MFDRFQVILPTLYYRHGSHDWHYHWYDGTSWCRTSLYRECEYKEDFWVTASFAAVEVVFIGAPMARELPSNRDGIASRCQWKVAHLR